MSLHYSTDAPVEGVIILSPSFHVLHMSPRATQLISPLTISPTQNPTELTLPTVLHDIGQDIRTHFQTSLSQGNGLTCDVERVISSSVWTIFVRGLGVPDHDGGEFLTVLIVSNSPMQVPSFG